MAADVRTTLAGRPRLLLLAAVLLLVVGAAFVLTDDGDGDDDVQDVSTEAADDKPRDKATTTSPAITVVSPPSDATATSTTTTTTSAGGSSDPAAGDQPPAADPEPLDVEPGGAPGLIRLGSIGTYSGGMSTFMLDRMASGREALRAWVEQVNARGGIAGNYVELLLADDAGDPQHHVDLTRTLVEQHGVSAFVGNLSLVGDAAGYLETVDIPVVGGDGLSGSWQTSPMLFPVGAGPTQQARAMVGLALRNGWQRVSLVECDGLQYCARGGAALLAAAEAAGLDIVARIRVALSETNFEPSCRAMMNVQSEGTFALLDADATARLVECAGSVVTGALGARSGHAFDGIQAVVPTFPWVAADSAATREYAAVATGQQTFAGPVAWASGRLLERAVLAGLDDGARRTATDAILRGLHTLRGETLGGLTVPLSYSAGGPNPEPSCAFVMQTVGGAWTAPSGSTPVC